MLAITLSRKPYKEYDELISLLTEEGKKMVVMAKGIKRSTSKNSFSAEPGNLVFFGFANGKQYPVLTNLQRVKGFVLEGKSLNERLVFSGVLDFFDINKKEGDVSDGTFHILLDWLEKFESGMENIVLETDILMIRVLREFGFMPSLENGEGENLFSKLSEDEKNWCKENGGEWSERIHDVVRRQVMEVLERGVFEWKMG